MNRRNLFATIAALPLLGMAGQCTLTPSQLQTDADLVRFGVDLFAPALKQADPSAAALIDRSVAAVDAADVALRSATGADARTAVQRLVDGSQAIAPVGIALLRAGSAEQLAATAALALLPAILAAAGIASAQTMRAVRPVMDVETARNYLRGLRR